MISSKDRSGWFGASDTAMVMGSWTGRTFMHWWMVKLGLAQQNYVNRAIAAGTMYEHRILDALGIEQKDRQVKLRRLRLRVNLDGETKDTIHEVKTHCLEKKFEVPFRYWSQVQVQMYATKKRRAFIDAYGLTEDDYKNFFNPVDPTRIEQFEITYDRDWVLSAYIPRLKYLVKCLKSKVCPIAEEVQAWK